MDAHRATLAPAYRGQGRIVLSLDRTLAYHPYSQIFMVLKPLMITLRMINCIVQGRTLVARDPGGTDSDHLPIQWPKCAFV